MGLLKIVFSLEHLEVNAPLATPVFLQRVRVAVWYILRTQTGSPVPTVGPSIYHIAT